MIVDLNLNDMRREDNSEKRKFTLKRKLKNNTIQKGRLDLS